jgi:hypothetical protein
MFKSCDFEILSQDKYGKVTRKLAKENTEKTE